MSDIVSVNVGYTDGQRSVTYNHSDGSKTIHIGGSVAWRNNNPGNLMGNPSSWGGVDRDKNGFIIFPDAESGASAKERLINNKWGNDTIANMLKGDIDENGKYIDNTAYAPASHGNDPDKYANDIHDWTGLDVNDKKIKDFTPEELKKLIDAMSRKEGNRPGEVINLPSDTSKPNTGGPFTDPNKPYSSPADKNRNGIPDILESAKDKFGQSRRQSSPIILDLDGDGVETTKVNQGVWFDHDGNGFAESTGWVGKDDGLLVRDVDGSGYIDVGSELFGNNTKLSNGKLAANGFEALKDLDAIANGGNADGKIDSNDAAWASLKVWKDANGDGYHSDGEVISLEQAGVKSLNVTYTNSTQVDVNGNAHQQLGSFTKTDGTTGKATDVWFGVDKMNTIAEDTQEVSTDIAALPELRGYGNVANLRQAMMKDSTGGLKALVEKFSTTASRQERMALMDSIIYKWTGTENVRYGSRNISKLANACAINMD